MPTLQTHDGYVLWHYIPSRPAAIVFVVLFALATIGHGVKMIQKRMWFCLPFVIGGLCKSCPALSSPVRPASIKS
jgi:hypothetical protein